MEAGESGSVLGQATPMATPSTTPSTEPSTTPLTMPLVTPNATPTAKTEGPPPLPDTGWPAPPDAPPSSPGGVTHLQAMATARRGVGAVLEADPLLADLPAEVTPEEVALQIALEYGQAMTVSVEKFTGEMMPIVVSQGARVQDLKQAVQRYVTLKESRQGSQASISWKYVWRTYSLCFDGQPLDKNKKLKEYGIRNRDTVTFVKRRRQPGDRH